MPDEIFSLAARAVDVLVQGAGIKSDEQGDDKAQILPLRQQISLKVRNVADVPGTD